MTCLNFLRGVAAAALVSFGTTASASTIVSVWNLSWSGAVGVDGVWGITSSGGAGGSGAFNPGFDHMATNVSISGKVLIRETAGLEFTRQDVVGLTLSVTNISNGAFLASYSINQDDLQAGYMSGVFSAMPGVDLNDPATATLTSLLLRENAEPGLPFRQFIGCPTVNIGCGDAFFGVQWGNDPSGPQTKPPNSGPTYGVITLLDGRSDPCCGSRPNSLSFFYLTPEDALASFKLTYFGRDVLPGNPGGLPSPIPLPAGLPLLLGGVGLLGWVGRRRPA